MVIHIVQFLTYFNTKEGIFGFYISNMISGKGLKPVLAIFKDLHIFVLSATLKSFGTSVGGLRGVISKVGDMEKCC